MMLRHPLVSSAREFQRSTEITHSLFSIIDSKLLSLLGNNNNNTLSTNNNNPNSNNNNLKDGINPTPNGNGGGSLGSSTDKESLTPSPPARSTDDVKSEPMELVCTSNNNNPDNEHSNDSVGEHDMHSTNGNDGKGSLR